MELVLRISIYKHASPTGEALTAHRTNPQRTLPPLSPCHHLLHPHLRRLFRVLPPRKVVTDFAAFGAPSTASVFGTAVASTPFSLAGGKAAFGGIRSATIRDEDEDEDDEDGRQRVGLEESSISLDQVSTSHLFQDPSEERRQAKRIAMQSAWRSARV